MVSRTWRDHRAMSLGGQVVRLGLVSFMAVLMLWAGPAIAEDAPDVPVVTEVPPTDPPPPPPTEAPPPPTEAPPPPTEAPVDPTEIPVDPTEAPVDPTEIPADPTEVPVDPTEEPTEEPTPIPTPAPAIPFAPVVDCQLIEAGELPTAGETTWSFQDCTATWDTEQVSAVQANAWSDAAGWQVIVVNANALDNQDVLNSSDGILDLTDSNQDDDGFASSRFYIGTQLGCIAPTSAQINLDLTATSTAPVSEDEDGNPLSDEPGETVTETASTSLVVDGHSSSAPSISLVAVVFDPIVNSLDSSSVSNGSITVNYSGAPAVCGWEVTISFSDFTSGAHSIPASNLIALGLSGLDGASLMSDGGVIAIVSPSHGTPIASDGTMTIGMQLSLNGYVPEGSYATTVIAQSLANP